MERCVGLQVDGALQVDSYGGYGRSFLLETDGDPGSAGFIEAGVQSRMAVNRLQEIRHPRTDDPGVIPLLKSLFGHPQRWNVPPQDEQPLS